MSLSSIPRTPPYHQLPDLKYNVAGAIIGLGIGLALAITFSRWTASSGLAFPQFVLALVLLFIIPGVQIVAWCRLKLTALEHLALGTVLGMVVTCFLYAVFLWLHVPSLLYLWVFSAAVPGTMRLWRARSFPTIDREKMLILVGICIAFLPMWILPHYYRNLSVSSDGGMVLVSFQDVLIHLSITNELAHEFPAQTPFISGQPLNYHAGMDFVAAVLHRFGGISVIDAVVRFCPTLFIAIDILAVYCLARRLGVSVAVGVATALLAILGEDFSFIPGLLQEANSIWSVAFFGMPTVFSLYAVNPMVMAFGVLFMSLFCLLRYTEERRGAWIIAATICCVSLLEIKIFAFILLVLSLGIALCIEAVMFRQATFVKPLLAILVLSLPLAFYTLVANRTTTQITWNWVNPLSNGYLQTFILACRWPWLQKSSLAGLGVYLLMTFGFRIIGFGELVRSFRLTRDGSVFKLLLAIFVVLGPVLTLTSTIVPVDEPGYDNSVWFMVTSKYVATLFVGIGITKLSRRLGFSAGAFVMISVALVSFPSTVQFFEKSSSLLALVTWQASIVDAASFLNREGQAGQVALSRWQIGSVPNPQFVDPILALTPLHVPWQYYGVFSSLETRLDRQRDIEDFWQSWQGGAPREDIIIKYGVNWIVAPPAETPRSLQELSRKTLSQTVLEKCFGNADSIIYGTRRISLNHDGPGSPCAARRVNTDETSSWMPRK
jgi:hypothetical protein